MNNINRTGYTQGTNTESNSYNIIPSNVITMANVNKPLTLIPIINGKPRYDMRKIANPGDPDIDFGEGVSGVLEIPYAQSQYNTIGGNPYPNMGTGINYGLYSVPPIDSSLEGYNYTPKQPNSIEDLTKSQSKNIYFDYNPETGDMGTPTKITAPGLQLKDVSMDSILTPERKKEIDANIRQSTEALDTKLKQQNNTSSNYGKPFMGAINPYGGWNMANASVMLGASIEDGNALGIIGSAGKILTEGFRNGFSGAAAMRRFRDSQKEYMDKDAEARRREGEYWAGTYQDGGKVSKKSGLLLTGNFLEGNDDHPMPNAEVERGEYLQTPDGNTMEMLGKRHSEGGELVSVPENTKVISDYLKIGGELSSYFKKNFNINVSAGSTFATVLDKYKKKIGLSDLLEEEADIMKKIVDQEEVEFESTRDLNLQVLSKKVNELQPEKQTLEKKFNEFVNIVYNKQEEQKPEETEGKYQDGGSIEQQNQLMVSVQKYAEMNGQNPEDVIKQLQSLPPEEQQQALQQIMTATDDGANQQQADTSNIENLIQQYAQITGQDPNTIIENLQNLDDQQLQQALQEIVQVVQQNSARQNPQEEMIEGNTSNPQEENLEQMKEGGEVKNKWISEKIRTLINEGREKDQAVAIAYSMWENHKHQDAKDIIADPLTKTMLRNDYKYGIPGVTEWVGSRVTDPNYDYTDLAKIAERFAYLRKQRNLDNTNIENMNISQLGKMAGEMQQYDLQKTPGLARDYSLNVGMTRKGLSTVVSDKTYMATLKKEDPNLYKKVQDSLKPDGSIKVGSYKDYTDAEREKLTEIVKKQPQSFQENFINKNYFDNEAYFRGIDKEKFYFTNEEEFNKFKEDNKDKNIDGYYKTDKKGIYVKPILLKDKEFDTPEERDKWLKDRKADSNYSKHFYDEEDIAYTPKVKGEAPSTPTENPNPKEGNGINPYLAKEMNNGIDLPMAVPDQSNLPPIYIPTSMRQVSNVQANRVFVSPEENLKELSKQSNTASNVLVESNPYTSAAGLANLQAQQNNSINQAITQTTIANQQDERNVSNINEERIMKRDQTNLSLADKYEKEAIVGLDNYYNEWRNFIDNRNKQNVVNWNLQNQQNMFNAINPNYKIGVMGQIYQTNEPYIIYVNGQPQMYDPKTKQVVTQKTTSPDGKTTTTTQTTKGTTKKKGGLIMSTNLLDLLKQ